MKLEMRAQQTEQELLQEFATSKEQGLSDQEVALRQKKYGLNTIVAQETKWWQILIRQFESPFMYMLMGAALLSFFLQDPWNTVLILLFVVLSATLGFYQEFYAEKTISLLKKYLTTNTQVLRNGTVVAVATESLVPGDIVVLTAGRAIPADVRFLQTEHVWIDESALTGESAPVHKTHEMEQAAGQTTSPAIIGLCGSMMTSGTAQAVVIGTASNTQFGSIAYLSTAITRRSIFAQEINTFSRFVMFFVVATIGCIFFGHLLIKGTPISIFELALFAIALSVSIIPEALPLVITFALSFGARRMAQKNVVVKRLSAIEDLGGIDILCSDKTGTITKNQLDVVDVYADDPGSTLLYAGLTCEEHILNDEQSINSFDLAILNHLPAEMKEKLKSFKTIDRLPFDHKARYNAALVTDSNQTLIIVRGALEFVIQHCEQENQTLLEKTDSWAQDQGVIGRRIIGLVVKQAPGVTKLESLEGVKDFTLAGLIAFEDPVKPTALEALTKAQHLGIAIKLITGDAVGVAAAVGKAVGLVHSPDEVVTGQQFDALPYEDKIKVCEKTAVFARILPDQKFQIIEILQKTHNVGFLGEGINDAPALKAAHIGIAVHNSTDVAKDAADIILLRKSLNTIVDGIAEGRRVMENSFKYLRGMVTSNFSNFYTIAFVSLLIDYLPMLPIQLLLINLLTDFPLISIATDNTDAAELKRPKRNRLHEVAWLAVFLGIFSTIFDLMFLSRFYHAEPEILRTNWFMYCIFTGLLFFYSIRTKMFMLTAARPSNPLIIMSTASLLLTLWLPYTAFGAHFFHFVAPTFVQLRWTFGIAVAYVMGMEVAKLTFYRFFRTSSPE